jgi:beta-galactosidase
MIKNVLTRFICLTALLSMQDLLHAQRSDVQILDHWKTSLRDTNQNKWQVVNLPHNWDVYDGYRRMLHGNLHGTALYKKTLNINKQNNNRYFLYFEGVGSYATVYVNSKKVGYHVGGRTGFSIDITDAINKLPLTKNEIEVISEHPANCQDLPWVCGGCSDERGFSEGSQPMGIFRPVHLMTTKNIRVEHEGVHIWNDTTVSTDAAKLFVATTVKNYNATAKNIQIITSLLSATGNVVATAKLDQRIAANATIEIPQSLNLVHDIHLWSPENPYRYKVLTQIVEQGKKVDQLSTLYGIRSIKWDLTNKHQLMINGKPIFLNGIGEYEHMLGNSHSFTSTQINARIGQIAAAGFNAFRDAHHPHNLLYQELLSAKGILWWTQMSAHIWYDNPAFRNNFKNLLREWVLERRNSPALIMWGLQNESKLPQDFAKECSDIIRSLDPTASSQRLITTCNGGEGTDWDVPQNWTGTYGGDPNTYASDLKKQILVGEYGAWRTMDLHTEGGFVQNGPYSEDRFSALLEKKIGLAESVKDSVVGHFQWLFASHDNPGRMQAGEGFRTIDQVGPVNYKGLFTSWDEPTSAYYMYRSNYANKYTDPMVYIPMHNWSNRWLTPGIKNELIIYSNCDEVVLYNDVNKTEIGRQRNLGIGKHFTFNDVSIKYNLLYAVGYVNGKAVATDCIRLANFPTAPNVDTWIKPNNITKPKEGYHYLYRVNCGGDRYTDVNGNNWLADTDDTTNVFYASSWTHQYNSKPAAFASQRMVADYIKSTNDQSLFQSIRYGKDALKYHFKVPNGVYRIELYFIEPWFGAGQIDASGWRIFDIRCNDKIVIKNLDIYKEAGTLQALQKTFDVVVTNGKIVIDFPGAAASQAVIAAIAVANKKIDQKEPMPLVSNAGYDPTALTIKSWLTTENLVKEGSRLTYFQLPSFAYGTHYMVAKENQTTPTPITFFENIDLYIGDTSTLTRPLYLNNFEKTTSNIITSDGKAWSVYKKQFSKNSTFIVDPKQTSILFFNPTPTLLPAFDLKQIVSIRPVQVKMNGSAVKDTINTKEAVVYNDAFATSSWPFTIGAADVYSLTIRYANTLTKEITGSIKLYGPDGSLLKSENVRFTPSKTGKWNYITTDTGTMVNAGRYSLVIDAVHASGLYVSGLEIQ